MNQADPQLRAVCLWTLTSAAMSRGDNCTCLNLLVQGIPSITQAWGMWVLLWAMTLLFLISLAAHLSQWTRGRSKSHLGQGCSGGSVEEVPLYGNLHYLQTGRLSQDPGPNQQDPTPGGSARVSQLWLEKKGGKEMGAFRLFRGSSELLTALHLQAAEEVMCYTSLQLRPPQGRIPGPGTPIKYSEVVLDSEPKPQASGPEPELYASVCAQTRRARASFPDQAYANSQPAAS
ncbi:signaling threshold-regulating transmembrane adapter 1 isoform X1 [Cebus imitator]|uniref:signaling threshold-regulating transmembrane adapter 1 isoform X1 n=1 Tax=Cebus imitator TaxID=2715852 RepID=UPI00080A721B|nr:signaling threshold-regulating transmembrane adapter 1 isoform X1 [Cebus imitator]